MRYGLIKISPALGEREETREEKRETELELRQYIVAGSLSFISHEFCKLSLYLHLSGLTRNQPQATVLFFSALYLLA